MSSQPSPAPIRRAVVPAAGLGTRLRPLTYAFPKELLPVGRKPVLGYVMEELASAGITEVLFIVSEAKPQIRGYFGEIFEATPGAEHVRCSYAIQEEQKGLGHAIALAEEWCAGSPFVVAFGDCIIESKAEWTPLQRMVATHVSEGSAATTLVETVPLERVSRYGIVAPVATAEISSPTGFRLQDIVEKPVADQAPSQLAVAARWILNASIFAYLKRGALDERGEINLTDAVRMQMQEGQAACAVPLIGDEARRDIGNFGTFFSAFIRSALSDPEYGDAAAAVAAELLRHRQ
jgi:UTP--glucose-1-phosphate uridylyltransferase